MQIRELTRKDYDALLEIWAAAGLSHRPHGRDSKEHFCREVGQSTAIFLGAETDRALIGVVLGTHDGRKGWINRLAVLPDHQHRGVGKALLLEVEKRLNELGIKIVTCLIEGENNASEGLFQSLGYVGHPDITYYSKRQSPDW